MKKEKGLRQRDTALFQTDSCSRHERRSSLPKVVWSAQRQIDKDLQDSHEALRRKEPSIRGTRGCKSEWASALTQARLRMARTMEA